MVRNKSHEVIKFVLEDIMCSFVSGVWRDSGRFLQHCCSHFYIFINLLLSVVNPYFGIRIKIKPQMQRNAHLSS